MVSEFKLTRYHVEARLASGIRDLLREAYEAGLRDGTALSLAEQARARPFRLTLRDAILEAIWLVPGITTRKLIDVTDGKLGSVRVTLHGLKADGRIVGSGKGWRLSDEGQVTTNS